MTGSVLIRPERGSGLVRTHYRVWIRYTLTEAQKDGSARLGLLEFQILWNKIRKWLVSQAGSDPDGSGLRTWFKLNNKLYQMLIARYADNEIIDFDNFTCCLVKLETMFRIFQGLDRDGTGTVEMNLMEWLFVTMCG
uniref:EF-hand domain-containing protein n=1 Tax=Xiphophorus couchianus TaxID=32473 RepID=A0A3B5M7V6_9TELE